MKDNAINRTIPAIRRIHQQFTHSIDVINFTYQEGGANAYSDGEWVEDSTTVEGTIRLAEDVEMVKNAAGEESEYDVYVWINPADATISDGDGDKERATEIIDSQTSRRYKVMGYHDESSLYRIECVKV